MFIYKEKVGSQSPFESRTQLQEKKFGVGGCTIDNSMLGYTSKRCSQQHSLEDHVMTDGNALLHQHELVMNHLISERGHKSLFQLLLLR